MFVKQQERAPNWIWLAGQGGYLHLESAIRGWAVVSGACVQFIRHLVYHRRVYGVEGIQIGPLRLSVGMFGQVSTIR